jgi:hypothetical protein
MAAEVEMPREKSNGNGKLEDALARVLQTQAVMQEAQAEMISRFAQFEKDMAQMRRESDDLKRISDERFARIESILLEHNRILSRLADTVGEKIGFKASPSPPKEE